MEHNAHRAKVVAEVRQADFFLSPSGTPAAERRPSPFSRTLGEPISWGHPNRFEACVGAVREPPTARAPVGWEEPLLSKPFVVRLFAASANPGSQMNAGRRPEQGRRFWFFHLPGLSDPADSNRCRAVGGSRTAPTSKETRSGTQAAERRPSPFSRA